MVDPRDFEKRADGDDLDIPNWQRERGPITRGRNYQGFLFAAVVIGAIVAIWAFVR